MHTQAIIYRSVNNDKQAAVPLTMMFVKPVCPLFTRDDNNTIIYLLYFPYSALARDTANDETDLHTTDCSGYNNNNNIIILYPLSSHYDARTIDDSTRYTYVIVSREVGTENRLKTGNATEK